MARDRLLRAARPVFEVIAAERTALTELRNPSAGTVRITTGAHAHQTILWLAFQKFLPDYPATTAQVMIEHGFVHIAAERFDEASVSEHVEHDMIAVRLGSEVRYIVVGPIVSAAG